MASDNFSDIVDYGDDLVDITGDSPDYSGMEFVNAARLPASVRFLTNRTPSVQHHPLYEPSSLNVSSPLPLTKRIPRPSSVPPSSSTVVVATQPPTPIQSTTPTTSMVRTRSQERIGENRGVNPSVDAVPDRDRVVRFPGIDKSFPAPSEYDDFDPKRGDDVNARLAGACPWFDRRVVTDHIDALAVYTDEHNFLPGQIHLDCLRSWQWVRAFAIVDSDLRTNSNQLVTTIRQDFALMCYEGLNRIMEIDPIPPNSGVDMFVCRSRHEQLYYTAIRGVPDDLLQSWHGIRGVRQAAILVQRPLLRCEFRYISRRADYGLVHVPGERWARSFWNLAVPHHCPQIEYMNRPARRRAFVRLTETFFNLEVPQGCAVGTPAICSYKSSEMVHRDSGWWVVFYTDFACKAAQFILTDVYDSLRLWYLPTPLIAAIRSLDLSDILGSQGNVDELHRLLRVIEGTDFYQYPESQSLRYDCPSDAHRRARWTPCADFIYYDPWEQQVLTTSQFDVVRTRRRRQMPVGHPVGYDFHQNVPGWDGVSYTSPEIDGVVELPLISTRPYVDFLDPEIERSAKMTLFVDPTNYTPVGPTGDGNPRSERRDDSPYAMVDSPDRGMRSVSQDVTASSRSEEEVIRDFLRRVGLSEASTSGTTTEMMCYLRGCLRL